MSARGQALKGQPWARGSVRFTVIVAAVVNDGKDQGGTRVGTSILGNRVQHVEDVRMLTSGGVYVDDLSLDNAAWLTYVRSTEAHAHIVSIDVDEAKAAPGVIAVFTGDDLTELGLAPNVNPSFPDAMRRPFVATGTVRYVGQPVVAVVAEDRYQAADAAELVVIDYDPLPGRRRSGGEHPRRGAAVPRCRDERRAASGRPRRKPTSASAKSSWKSASSTSG